MPSRLKEPSEPSLSCLPVPDPGDEGVAEEHQINLFTSGIVSAALDPTARGTDLAQRSAALAPIA
jgi:hypothetical protein